MSAYMKPATLASLYDFDKPDVEQGFEIRSDTIDPLTTSSRRVKFRLEPIGYLDSNSLLLFKMTGPAAADNYRASCVTGGLGAIKMARLSVGDTIISETQQCGRVLFMDKFSKLDRDSMSRRHAHYLGNSFTTVAPESTLASEDAATGQVVMSDECGSYFGLPANYNNRVVRSQAIQQGKDLNYQVGILLGDLFPCLKRAGTIRTLPLYLFDQYRIYIDIEFEDGDKFVNKLDGAQPGGGISPLLQAGAGDISYTDIKLQVDYVIMPSGVLDADRAQTNKDGGLTLNYYDYLVVEKVLAAQGAGEQEVEFRIGAQERDVHAVTMLKQLTTVPDANFSGRNRALMLNNVSDAVNVESYQVNVNGVDRYPFFIESPATQYDLLSYGVGGEPEMERPFLFQDDNDFASGITTAQSGLAGTYKPLSCDLRNGLPVVVGGGTLIGKYPIVWKYKRTGTAGANDGAGLTTRNKMNGAANVDFIVKASKQARIMSTPVGMDVTVGV